MESIDKVAIVMTLDVIVLKDLTHVVGWDSVVAKTIQFAVHMFVVLLITLYALMERGATHTTDNKIRSISY